MVFSSSYNHHYQYRFRGKRAKDESLSLVLSPQNIPSSLSFKKNEGTACNEHYSNARKVELACAIGPIVARHFNFFLVLCYYSHCRKYMRKSFLNFPRVIRHVRIEKDYFYIKCLLEPVRTSS